MAGFDQSVANTIIKRQFDSKDTVSQLMDQAPYWASRRKTPADLGDSMYANIQTGRNQSIGIRNSGGSDNENLPDISQPTFQSPIWDTVRIYDRIYMTGKAADRTSSTSRSFAHGVAFLVDDMRKSHNRDMEGRAFNGSTATGNKTGCRGILNNTAYVGGGASSTFTLDIATAATHRRYKRAFRIEPGMKLDVYSKTTWAKAGEINVTAVSHVNSTFVGTLNNGLAGTADEWYLFRNGDFNRDVNGLVDVIDDGTFTATFGGLTSGGLWVAGVSSNSGTTRPLGADILDEAILASEEQNDLSLAEAWMPRQVYKSLLLMHQRNIILNKGMGNEPVKANLGGAVEQYDGVDIKKSSMAIPNTILLAQKGDIEIMEQVAYKPLNFGQGGRDVFWRFVPGMDAWEAVFVHEWQQKSRRRNVHYRIDDIEEA